MRNFWGQCFIRWAKSFRPTFPYLHSHSLDKWSKTLKLEGTNKRHHLLISSPLLQVYKVILEIVFKLAPTLLIASLNIRIMIVYRRTCNKRRRMTLSHTKDDDSRKFAEERRLMFLLGTHKLFSLFSLGARDDKTSADKTLIESGINHDMFSQVALHCCSLYACLPWRFCMSLYPRRICQATLIKWVDCSEKCLFISIPQSLLFLHVMSQLRKCDC